MDLLRPTCAEGRRPRPPAVSAADQAQALEVLGQAQEAMGGKAFVEQRTQISKGAGTLSPPGMPQPMPIQSIITYRVLPDKERTEIKLPMGT